MRLTKRKEILTPEISLHFCETYLQQTVKHLRALSAEMAAAISAWLLEDPRKSINTVDFDLQIRKFYNHDGARERTWAYWTRRGWTEAEAKGKVATLQGSTRKQNIARLAKDLGSVEVAVQAVLARDKRSSHRCKEFWEAKGLDANSASTEVFNSQRRFPTTETKEKIKRSSKRSVQYWVANGFSQTEARQKVAEHQSTFSLESCIAKYGEIQGTARWLKRQEQWQSTLLAKPLEEQERINHAKMSSRTGGCSKISKQLFESLSAIGGRWGAKSGLNLGEKIVPGVGNRRYMIDFVCGNKAIEFNGDFWHANPSKFKPADLIRKHRTLIFTAQEIWDNDAAKAKAIKAAGYDLLIVWEHDYRTNPEAVIASCKEFLSA